VNCPGQFSLQVAQFAGRSTYELNPIHPQPSQGLDSLRTSPLQTAHDDAERLADKLSKAPEIQRFGQPIYVYHDRTSSRVYIGSFNSAQDPAAAALHAELVKQIVPLMDPKRGKATLDHMIVPAAALTDLKPLKAQLR
jgi:hypothetical protein